MSTDVSTPSYDPLETSASSSHRIPQLESTKGDPSSVIARIKTLNHPEIEYLIKNFENSNITIKDIKIYVSMF